MMTSARRWARRLAVVVVGGLTALSAIGQAFAAPAARVEGTLRIANQTIPVILVGMQADKVRFRFAENPRVETAAKLKDIQAATFKIVYDQDAVRQAMARRDWDAAARTLYAAAYPLLPFLPLPDNNGAALAMRAGNCLMRGAAVRSRCGTTAAERKLAEADYKTALHTFEKTAAAKGFEEVEAARLNAILCRVLLDRLDEAQAVLGGIGVPGRTDDTVGLYWLVRSRLAFGRGQFRDALAAAVQSVGFGTKDPDTFPDALLLSGLCYEQLGQLYRARDVYYEVASLFQRTPWADVALARLPPIMAAGQTRGQEPVPITTTFFESEDDVNTKVQQLLAAAKASQKPDVRGPAAGNAARAETITPAKP